MRKRRPQNSSPHDKRGGIGAASAYYGGILGMKSVMELGWIVTFAPDASAAPQLSVAVEGGSGAPVSA